MDHNITMTEYGKKKKGRKTLDGLLVWTYTAMDPRRSASTSSGIELESPDVY